jgi:hypothetical protein
MGICKSKIRKISPTSSEISSQDSVSIPSPRIAFSVTQYESGFLPKCEISPPEVSSLVSLSDPRTKQLNTYPQISKIVEQSRNIKIKRMRFLTVDELIHVLSEFESSINFNNTKQIVKEIISGYNNHPYHNYLHALTFVFNQIEFIHNNHDFIINKFNEYNIDMQFNKFIFIFILCGLSHDIGHIGITNAQLRLKNHEWALKNNNSPAEHYHASKFIEILNKYIIISDKHKIMFKDFILSTSLEISSDIFTDISLFKYIMCFADLSHWSSSTEIHIQWYKRIKKEFANPNAEFIISELVQINKNDATMQVTFSQMFFKILSYLNSEIPKNEYMLQINQRYLNNISFWNSKVNIESFEYI